MKPVTPTVPTVTLTPSDEANRTVLGSIARFLDIFGDPWSVLLLRDVFLGVTRFDEFHKSIGITRQTLSDRLRRFTDHAILTKVVYQERPLRHEYRLTEKGRALGDFALMIWVWQTRWSEKDSFLPRILWHHSCGGIMVPQMVCSTCKSPPALADISVTKGPGEIADRIISGGSRRWVARGKGGLAVPDQSLLRGTYILGDRWNNLILACALLGIRSFAAIVDTLGISTNVLAHRLKVCVEVGLLASSTYNHENRSYEYGLTRMTHEMLPVFLSISQWSDKWLRPPNVAVPIWYHSLCESPFESLVTGRCCGQPALLSEIKFSERPGRQKITS